MEVYSLLIDWQEAETRAKRGFFGTEEDENDEGTWRVSGSFEGVLLAEFQLGAACDAIFPLCSEPNRIALTDSYGRFMTEGSGQWNELSCDLNPEYHWLALSPATVKDIRLALERVDYDELKRLYEDNCPQAAQEILEYTPEDFVEHLRSWARLFEEASLLNLGIMVVVG